MAALSEATVIVEAGETSGTLKQAKAALKQGRKVFILNSNFENPQLTWPHKLQESGAIRVHDVDDILQGLPSGTCQSTEN
jgi:DNA processing protein